MLLPFFRQRNGITEQLSGFFLIIVFLQEVRSTVENKRSLQDKA